MCRWFAYIAPEEECLLEDVLIVPAHALSKQTNEHYLPNLFSHMAGTGRAVKMSEISRRNIFNNVDGFGLVWYTNVRREFNEASGPRPALYKNGMPITNDQGFHAICANTSSTNVLCHIRSATATAVVGINNHPFVFGRHAIMHNGVISSFIEVRREVVKHIDKACYQNIFGSTDSEYLAALYMTYLTKSSPGKESWEKAYSVSEMKEALESAIRTVVDEQRKVLGEDKFEASSLNVCCSDGSQMIAFRFRNHAKEQPPSLYWSSTAGMTLNRKYPDHPDAEPNTTATKEPHEHGIHLIVASEPTTHKVEEWNLIDKNHAVLVSSDGKHTFEPINTTEDMLATAETTQEG